SATSALLKKRRLCISRVSSMAPGQRPPPPPPPPGGGAPRHSESVLWCSYAQLCEVPLSALDFIGLCDRYRAILMDDLPCLSASQREGRIARGTEDGVQLVEAGDRELPQLSVHDDGVRRFIALVDECYDRKVPLYLEARVPLEALYTEGYLAFAFRRTLSRLREMQLARFGSDSAG
ncbi:AFG1/ZapE family ATPase, partial [Pseudomonas aeruginosa]|uniref:AFG1/ZapE family ATPase n=1 Tax=Pseudomonas aeruginosa TaxID=287 RepID=UPI00399D6287